MGLAGQNPSKRLDTPNCRPMSDEERQTMIGRWALDTCLVFGTTFETAALVAEHFVSGLRQAWKMT